MSDCSIIISTANDRIRGLKLGSFPEKINYLVVHQVYDEGCKSILPPEMSNFKGVNYLRLDYPGLSKSRNIGIDRAESEFAYIMDDDVKFYPDKIKLVAEWMDHHKVDVATCQFMYEDGCYARNYIAKPFKHTKISAAKVSSIEICVNVRKIREKGIKFDEMFGLGSDFPSGEEYIFLTDCIKAGLKVWSYPIVTGVHPNVTSGMDFYSTPNKIVAKREMFKRVFGWKSTFFIFAFWLKKLPCVYGTGFFWTFTKTLLFGSKEKL